MRRRRWIEPHRWREETLGDDVVVLLEGCDREKEGLNGEIILFRFCKKRHAKILDPREDQWRDHQHGEHQQRAVLLLLYYKMKKSGESRFGRRIGSRTTTASR